MAIIGFDPSPWPYIQHLSAASFHVATGTSGIAEAWPRLLLSTIPGWLIPWVPTKYPWVLVPKKMLCEK